MAAIPKRAVQAEAVLLGKVMSAELIQHAQVALAQDFQPLSDGRASSAYRLQVAQNCLQRFYLEKIEDTPMTRVDDLIALVEV